MVFYNIVYVVALMFYGYTVNLEYGGNLPVPTTMGLANAERWDGGTVISAHNYLSGDSFYELSEGSIVVALLSDGNRRRYEVIQTGIFLNQTYNWDRTMYKFSEPDHLTLYTCFPRVSYLIAPNTDGYLFLELSPLKDEGDKNFLKHNVNSKR